MFNMSAVKTERRFHSFITSSIFSHIILLYFLTTNQVSAQPPQNVISRIQELTDDNWKVLLEGEWFVKFYAPWCPACQSLVPLWESLANNKDFQHIHVADIDVTSNAALSGKFFVTALPTIYHVKDGVFRVYRSSRSESEFRHFIVDKKWQDVDPVPWYQHPDSYHMSALGLFFQVSISIRNLHSSITEDYGIPVWGSYLIIALATVIFGLGIGLLIVCFCDVLCQSKDSKAVHSRDYLPASISASKDDKGDESDVLDDADPSYMARRENLHGASRDLRESETSDDDGTRRRIPRQD